MANPFSMRTVVILAAVASVSLVAFLYLVLAEEKPDPERSAGTNSYSRSAVGHRAFVATLRELGIPVTVSRFDSGSRAGETAVLVILEPRVESDEDKRRLRWMVDAADRVLLVLPKRTPLPDFMRRGFVRRADLSPVDEPQAVLDALDIEGEVVRPVSTDRFTTNRYGVEPTTFETQLIRGGLVSHLDSSNGVLVGARTKGRQHMLVLADPGPIENHGIGRGDNAVFVLELLEHLRKGRRPVFVDETLHGFETPPRLFSALLKYPLVLLTITACLALVLLLLAGTGRFGAPRPAKPQLASGKDVLLTNTAELLAAGSHAGYVVSRYFRATLEDVARTRHAPAGLSDKERLAWLTRVEEERALEIRAGELDLAAGNLRKRQSGDAARALALARRIHKYQKEMKDGA